MAKRGRIKRPVTLATAIDEEQHKLLLSIAFRENLTLAEVFRRALDEYIKKEATKAPIRAVKAG